MRILIGFTFEPIKKEREGRRERERERRERKTLRDWEHLNKRIESEKRGGVVV